MRAGHKLAGWKSESDLLVLNNVQQSIQQTYGFPKYI